MPLFTVPESLIRCFKFIGLDGRVNEGMWNEGNLYSCVASFTADQEQQAYALGYSLAQYDAQIVVTCSEQRCRVWRDLRSSNAFHVAPISVCPA